MALTACCSHFSTLRSPAFIPRRFYPWITIYALEHWSCHNSWLFQYQYRYIIPPTHSLLHSLSVSPATAVSSLPRSHNTNKGSPPIVLPTGSPLSNLPLGPQLQQFSGSIRTHVPLILSSLHSPTVLSLTSLNFLFHFCKHPLRTCSLSCPLMFHCACICAALHGWRKVSLQIYDRKPQVGPQCFLAITQHVHGPFTPLDITILCPNVSLSIFILNC